MTNTIDLFSDVFSDVLEQCLAPSDFTIDSDFSLPPSAATADRAQTDFTSKNPNLRYHPHPIIDGEICFILNISIANVFKGKPCQQDGSHLMPGERLRPEPPPNADPTNWGAFESKEGFEIAELVYHKAQMSAGNIDDLLRICFGGRVPFLNHNELYSAIDSLDVGGVPWQSFSIQYDGGVHGDDGDNRPKWMSDVHDVFYRDPRLVVHEMLANPDFKDGMDFAPYRIFDKDGIRTYQHLMSGDWAWDQAVSSSSPTSPSYWLDDSTHAPLNVGCDRSGSKDAWGDVRPHHSGKRQDDSIGSDRSHGSLSVVPVNWESS